MDGKVDFAFDYFLVDFFFKNSFAVNSEEGFAVFFVADGFDDFELKLTSGRARLICFSTRSVCANASMLPLVPTVSFMNAFSPLLLCPMLCQKR